MRPIWALLSQGGTAGNLCLMSFKVRNSSALERHVAHCLCLKTITGFGNCVVVAQVRSQSLRSFYVVLCYSCSTLALVTFILSLLSFRYVLNLCPHLLLSFYILNRWYSHSMFSITNLILRSQSMFSIITFILHSWHAMVEWRIIITRASSHSPQFVTGSFARWWSLITLYTQYSHPKIMCNIVNRIVCRHLTRCNGNLSTRFVTAATVFPGLLQHPPAGSNLMSRSQCTILFFNNSNCRGARRGKSCAAHDPSQNICNDSDRFS